MTGELPITPAELRVPRVIKAYCRKCKTITDNVIYNSSGNLYVKCVGCGKDVYVGNRGILAFETLTCRACGRETLWVVYCGGGPPYLSDNIYLACLGCGMYFYAGNRCPL